jgi:hypothetical protein
MRSTVELGSSKSYAKIIRVGIYRRILTGIHTRLHPIRSETCPRRYPSRAATPEPNKSRS